MDGREITKQLLVTPVHFNQSAEHQRKYQILEADNEVFGVFQHNDRSGNFFYIVIYDSDIDSDGSTNSIKILLIERLDPESRLKYGYAHTNLFQSPLIQKKLIVALPLLTN